MLFLRIVGNRDQHVVENTRRALNDVEMSPRERVEAAGINRNPCHGRSLTGRTDVVNVNGEASLARGFYSPKSFNGFF